MCALPPNHTARLRAPHRPPIHTPSLRRTPYAGQRVSTWGRPVANVKVANTRSVDNLQRLYTMVITLSVAEALRRVLGGYASPSSEILQIARLPSYLMLGSLLVTIVPFYHGANRYLDATYVTGERTARRVALILDFLALFAEGILFFVLALFTGDITAFYVLLAVLLVFDCGWILLTRVSAEETSTGSVSSGRYVIWAAINVATALIILYLVLAPVNCGQWLGRCSKDIYLSTLVLVRTVLDYALVWGFYYPKAGATTRKPRSVGDGPADGPAPAEGP